MKLNSTHPKYATLRATELEKAKAASLAFEATSLEVKQQMREMSLEDFCDRTVDTVMHMYLKLSLEGKDRTYIQALSSTQMETLLHEWCAAHGVSLLSKPH